MSANIKKTALNTFRAACVFLFLVLKLYYFSVFQLFPLAAIVFFVFKKQIEFDGFFPFFDSNSLHMLKTNKQVTTA